ELALAQELVVGAIELALSDRTRRLQLLDGTRACRQAHDSHAARDRAGGDDHDLLALTVQRGDDIADSLQHAGAQLSLLVGNDARAELDDHALHPWSLCSARRLTPAGHPKEPQLLPRLLRIQLEGHSGDLQVVTGLESLGLQGAQHTDLAQASLKVGHRIL